MSCNQRSAAVEVAEGGNIVRFRDGVEVPERGNFMLFCEALNIVHGLANHYLHGDQPPAVGIEAAAARLDRLQLALDTVEDYIVNQCADD